MKTNQRGFTLIEVVVATAIVAGGIMVMATAWSGNFMRVRNSRINNTMATLLEKKMTEYEIVAKEKPDQEIPETEGGDFGAKFPGYRWEMKSQPFEMPDMSSALISKEGGADEISLMIVRTTATYIKDAVKEISVAVFYKARNGKEIKQSAATYLVDYTKEIPMPAGMPGMPAGGAPAGGAPAGGAPGGAGGAVAPGGR